MPLLFSLPAALVLIVITVRMWRADNRRLSIGVVAAFGGYFVLESVLAPLDGILPVYLVYALPLSVLPLLLLVLAAYLIGNGLRMLRRESRSLANALSLIAGVGLLAVPLVTYLAVTAAASVPEEQIVVEAALIAFVAVVALGSAYVAAFFVLFLAYGAVYRRARVGAFDAIIVLGAGLIDGQVPPLLASRLDRAIGLFDARRAAGDECVLIPTGGQGRDEPRAEGEAMAEYLVTKGVASQLVLAETEAKNTEQNLMFSRSIADGHRPGSRMLIVTSEYHVLRAAMLARRAGLRAPAKGARTARYFLPSATLREFIAIALMFPRIQVLAGGLILLMSAAIGLLIWLANVL